MSAPLALRPSPERLRERLADVPTGLLAGGASLGAAALLVYRPWLALLVPAAAVWVLVLSDWRRGVTALLLFLPFAGLPAFLLDVSFAPVLKDVVLVLPLYVSFALAALQSREPVIPRRDPVISLLALFALLVVAYVALSESLLVGLIGTKVWIAYLPMYVVGFHYVRRLDDAVGAVRRTALLAVVPATLAFAELVSYVRHGDLGPLRELYGTRAGSIEQEVSFSEAIPRIPSTFTAAHSYYNFGLAALAAALAWWLYRRRGAIGLLVLVLALATVASGIRRSYLTVPLLVVLSLVVARASVGVKLRVAAAVVVVLLGLSSAGVGVGGIAEALRENAPVTARVSLAAEPLAALSQGFFGSGTGSDTQAAARYGDAEFETPWLEGWYTKAFVELGFAGLVLVALLVAAVLYRGLRAVRSLDPGLRRLAAPLWVLLLASSLTLVKASELDWDPLNVYFWLFAGALAGLAHWHAPGRRPPPARKGAELP